LKYCQVVAQADHQAVITTTALAGKVVITA
jgi:hypothetical protein